MDRPIRVSMLMLTLDRKELTISTWLRNVAHASVKLPSNVEIEHLICDNGSKDKGIVEYFSETRGIKYHRINSANEGCGRAFNQLYLRCTGDIVVLLGNDIVNSAGWLEECLKYSYGVPNSGLVGIDWGHGGIPPLATKWGTLAHWLTPQLNRVFGTWVLPRRVIDEIGFFYEGYDVYGLEDSDVNERINMAGFNSFYVPNTYITSKHLANDVGEKSEYRRMKDQSAGKNLAIFHDRVAHFNERGIREPLPTMRSPL